MGKTHRKQQILSARSRTTRSHKPRLLLSDPTESSAHLTAQLRALGLYAANTLGDGNCLFRALSDQLYGSHTKHTLLRQAVCAFIEANKARYAPFCEDERGLDVHLRCMRENGTYGAHLELSAFAHMVKRNVKVVQPGLVYVIEWGAGLDAEEREVELGRRRKEEEREREREGLVMCVGTVYVAYHDWEHFSSIRNLNGPHAGLPNVVETPADDDDDDDDEEEEEIPVRRDPKKERERERREKEKRDKMRRITKVKLKLSAPPSTTNTPPPEPAPAAMKMNIDTLSSLSSLSSLTSAASTPAPSPSPAPTSVPLSTISSSSSPPAAAPMLSTVAAAALPAFRVHRSPKRSFDESASSEDGQSVVSDDVERGRGRDKRSRMGSVVGAADLAAGGEASGEVDGGVDGEVDGEASGWVDGEGVDGKVEEPPASQVSVGSVSVGMEGVEGERERDSEEELKEEAEVVAAIALGGGGAAAQEIVDEGYSSLSSLSDSEDEDDAQSDNEHKDEDEDEDGDEEHGYEEEGEEEEEQKDTAKATLKAKGKKGKGAMGAMEKQVHLGEDGKPLTRKQRKQLGLPKFRGVPAHAKGGKGVSAGRIVIPGGRFKGRAVGGGVGGNVGAGAVGGKDEEWVKTGVGRVDVRGFRELKI